MERNRSVGSSIELRPCFGRGEFSGKETNNNQTKNIPLMYILTDTFNRSLISRHRSAQAAVRAQRKHLSAVRKMHGENSYLTYSIRHSSGRDIQDEVMDATFRLDMER